MKTKDQAQSVKDSIIRELNALPGENVFGESNADSIDDLQGWVDELSYFIVNGDVQHGDTEVGFWLSGSHWSELEDYQ